MEGRIRLTRPGAHALGLGALTLWAALASGNNLLYLVYGLIAAAFVVQWAALRWSTRGLRVRAQFPESVRQGAPFSLEVRAAAAQGWRAVRGAQAAVLAPVAGSEEVSARLEASLPNRGWNALEGLRVETAFPFAVLAWSAPVRARALALPRSLDGASWEEIESVCEASGIERPKRGGGDELYGMRPYAAGDEPRLINWKLSLRAGRTFVNEFAAPAGAKVTVRVEELTPGEAGERRVAAAGAALERCASSGVEFRLALREETTPFGTGRGHLLACLEALAKAGEGGAERAAPPPAGRPETLPASHPGLQDLTRLGTLLVYAGLFLIDDIETRLLLACAPAFALSWAMSRGLVGRLPEAVWTPVSAAVLVFSLAVDWRASGVTLANTHLLLYMLVNRLLARLEPVDLRQTLFIHFLAFFLVSGQTISPWYFPFFLAFAAYSAAWLRLAMAPDRGRVRPIQALPAAAVLGLAAFLFALTPRIEPLRQTNPFVKLGLDKRKPSAQFAVRFTENVSLGFFGQLKRSSARVMRVKPLGGWGKAQQAGAPPRPVLMLRGAAFDRFDGRRWSKGMFPLVIRQGGRARRTDGKAWARRDGRRLHFPGGGRAVGPGIEVTLYPLNSAVVFTAAGLTSLESEEPAAWFDHTDTVYFAAPYLSGTSYRAWGRTRPTGFGGAIEGFDALLAGPYLEVPDPDPRVARLAAELTRGAATPIEKARAVTAGLRARYRYSTFSDDASRDLSGFLFSARSGNCEYFATAAAVLLRHAGVPTRLVAGFLADEWNEYGRFYDVRQGQAHAWVEAWTGEGWLTVDATPPAGAAQERAFQAMGKLKRWLTAAQLRWYRNVIGFDSFVQRDALRRARTAMARRRLAESAEALWPYLRGALLAAAAAGAALGLAPLFRRRPRRRFADAERLLAEAGLPRRPEQTAREYAASVASARPELAAAGALAELHYRELYDPRGLDDGAAREGARLLGELRAAVYNKRRR